MKRNVWLSVISLLVLFCFALLAIGSGTDDEKIADKVAEAPSSGDNGEEQDIVVLKKGDTVSYADWDYKVVDVETHTTIGDETARGIYVVAIVEATNNSKSTRDMGGFFKVIDKEGRTFEFDSSASLAHHHAFERDTWHYEDIGASFSAIMPFAFDVPKDAEDLKLIPRDVRTEELSEVNPILLIKSIK